jgi:hypothetical protein
MTSTQLKPSDLSVSADRVPEGGVWAARPGIYVLIVLAIVIAVSGYSLRRDGVFSCQATGYASNRYLAYCQATSYGDYDHGAFWFGLEPQASEAAASADVLFIGNSRMELGFSSRATDDWFTSFSAHYFLMGFSHYANIVFEAPLLRKLNPRARVIVINADRFFEQSESAPARTVLHDSTARARYEQKRHWQPVHRALCSTIPALCGDEYVIYRSRATGRWQVTGGQIKNVPVSYDGEGKDEATIAGYVASGEEFLSALPISRECVILALVPYVKTDVTTARVVAARLGVTLIAPQPDSLNTFDGGHLDRPSAERWSAAFFAAAGPRIRQCLAGTRLPGTMRAAVGSTR